MSLHLAFFDWPTIVVALILVILFVLLVLEAIKSRGFSHNVIYLIIAIMAVLIVFMLLF